LVVVHPETLIRWHRAGWKLFWRLKSRPGRPPIPLEVQELIRRMANENPSWGEERIANELLLKLGLRVSPRTIWKYLSKLTAAPGGKPRRDQRWSTFLKNHAAAIVACDFCVVVSATFRMLYVLVVMEHASRRIVHLNLTNHPTAAWTLQQLREAIPSDHSYRFILHDRDAIFSRTFDDAVAHLGLGVIPLTEQHLRETLRSWLAHYNRGRPHSSLGPGLPDPPLNRPAPMQRQRHRFDQSSQVVVHAVLNGLHHEYRLTRAA
jgi:transposase InsO family protein